ncbi:hypothetical protein [Microlunatus sp. Y2014]|uniref:hypothetical protein n=1 Tax=Microlunatus sp. Y2014 TaxID=3418488 RepID=UPI003DA74B89
MAHRPTRRSVLAATLAAAALLAAPGCSPWGRRNTTASPEAQAAVDGLREALRDAPGVAELEVRFVAKAMQAHEISASVVLEPDLSAAALVEFGRTAHAAVVAHQIPELRTTLGARTTLSKRSLSWTIHPRATRP